jgi:hypothetical protein
MAPNLYKENPDELNILLESSRRTANNLQIIGVFCIGIALAISVAVMSGILK